MSFANTSRQLFSQVARASASPSCSTLRLATPLRSSTAAFASRHPRFISSTPRRLADKETPPEEKLSTKEDAVGTGLGIDEGANGAAKADSKSAEGGASELENKLQEKESLIRELKDQLLYGKADMQNLQRRSNEEKAQASDYAITKFAKDLTSSLDILALALRSVPEALRTAPSDASDSADPRKVVAELYQGVDLTSKSIVEMLARHGVTTFDPTGEKFDPTLHEALYQAPVPGKEPGTVLECSKSGYKIKGRILRAAQVGVVQES